MDNSEQSALEAAQENRAQVQAIHRPLKQWYNGTPAGAAMKAAGMGSFPTFWQDLANWPHFREVRKAYHSNPDGAEVSRRAAAEASEDAPKPESEAVTDVAEAAAVKGSSSATDAPDDQAVVVPAKPSATSDAGGAGSNADGGGGGGGDDDDDDDDDEDIEAPPMLMSLSDAMPAQDTSMLHADQYEQDDEAEAEEERRQAEEETQRRAAKEAARQVARDKAAAAAPQVESADIAGPKSKPARSRGRWGTEVVEVAKRPAPQVLAGTLEAESIAFAYKPLLDELAERRAARGETASSGSATDGASRRRKRRRRWQSGDDTSSLFGARVVPAVLAMMPRGLTGRQQRVFLLKVQKEELLMRSARVVEDAKAKAEDPSRSPSPPAQYDSNGRRTNSREQRLRAALTKRKLECDEWIAQLNPASCGLRGPTFKRKVYIPYKRYPEHNFIGQIIGPRGATQQQLERETGCKISIRGRGSRKEGKARRDGTPHEDDDDEAHVMLLGPDLYAIEGAVKVIEKMLIPDTDDAIMEAHKNRQLIQLAKVNGTYKRDEMALVAMQQAAESGKAATERRVDQLHHMLDVRPEQRSEEDRQYIELMATLGDKTAIALKAKDARAGASE